MDVAYRFYEAGRTELGSIPRYEGGPVFDFTRRGLLHAIRPIPTHALVAVAITLLCHWQIAARKGTTCHRIVG